VGAIDAKGTEATAAHMADGSTARFGWRGVVGTLSCSEGFALEVDQFLARLVALCLDGGKLGLGIGELGTELHLLGEQIGKQAA
jgi:hypothetical protein